MLIAGFGCMGRRHGWLRYRVTTATATPIGTTALIVCRRSTGDSDVRFRYNKDADAMLVFAQGGSSCILESGLLFWNEFGVSTHPCAQFRRPFRV